jgi:hypothetical protein
LLGAGRLDDKTLHTLAPDIGKGEIKPDLSEGEVYSGSNIDKSKERVRLEGAIESEWSSMSAGEDPIDNRPMSGNYIAFSIEEILMLEFQYIATRGDYEEVIDI